MERKTTLTSAARSSACQHSSGRSTRAGQAPSTGAAAQSERDHATQHAMSSVYASTCSHVCTNVRNWPKGTTHHLHHHHTVHCSHIVQLIGHNLPCMSKHSHIQPNTSTAWVQFGQSTNRLRSTGGTAPAAIRAGGMPNIPHANSRLRQPINTRWQLQQLRGAAWPDECSNACTSVRTKKESPTLSSAHGAAGGRCDH